MTDGLQWEDGSAIIKQNPHLTFDKVLKRGYNIEFRIEQDRLRDSVLLVRIIYGEREIGVADFNDEGCCLWPQNVEVDKGYRRQGIANAMHVFAEKSSGKILCNLWSDGEQSPEYKAVWAQPNRPFGNSLQ